MRKPEYRAIVDSKLFDVAEKIVASLGNDLMTYSLVKNDVTHVRGLRYDNLFEKVHLHHCR